jgi:hypothetical protein
MTKTDRPAFDWPAARNVIQTEMDRLGMDRAELSRAAAVPIMTVYEAFKPSAKLIYAHTLDRLLAGIGRDFGWLTKALNPKGKPHARSKNARG